METVVRPEAMITSNTSSLPAERIFFELRHKNRATVTHFFAPALRNPIVEVIRWRGADARLVDDLDWIFCMTGKVPLVQGSIIPTRGYNSREGQRSNLRSQGSVFVKMPRCLAYRDADPVAQRQPEKVIPRVKALLGETAEFELEWCSVYTFSCERMETFRHGRVMFAGDSAHRVSPFGARGANSGVQDTDNLAWKLSLVLEGKAPDRLLDTYANERGFAADENILNSTRSTDFITPKSEISRIFRDATLTLAKDCAFARRLVNSGPLSRKRFSFPRYKGHPIETEEPPFAGGSLFMRTLFGSSRCEHQRHDAGVFSGSLGS